MRHRPLSSPGSEASETSEQVAPVSSDGEAPTLTEGEIAERKGVVEEPPAERPEASAPGAQKTDQVDAVPGEERSPHDLELVDRIRSFNRFMTRQMGLLGESYSESDLSLSEARVLYELAQRDQVTAGEICDRLGLDAGYASRILTKFKDGGLVSRSKSPKDRRRMVLTLTEGGRSVFDQLEDAVRCEIGGAIGAVAGSQRKRAMKAMATLESLLSGDRGTLGPVFVRSLKPGDLGWVVQSHAHLYAEEYGFDVTFEGLVAEIVADFVKNHDPGCEQAWIAESDGENVGCVFLVRESTEIAKLRLLLIDPRARGLGLGKQLVRNCIEFARQSGYQRMTLWTQQNLTAARAIYQQAGFVCTHEEINKAFGQDLVSETWNLEL